MSNPAVKTTFSVAGLVLDIAAGCWVLAAIVLGNGLWQSADPSSSVTPSLSTNFQAILAIATCMLAATVSFGFGAVLHAMAKRTPGPVGN